MEIRRWLDAFKQGWVDHDVDRILSLFAPDVEYWETPYVRLNSFEALAQEWQGIREQSDIKLDLKLFTSKEESHSVIWNLSYVAASGNTNYWAGTYLIRLNDTGKCTYLHQTGEPKPQ